MSPKGITVTKNKFTVERYMDGFNASNHELILSCLTDDVVWDMPGGFHLVGKDAFDKEIENPAFVGRPKIAVTRVVEEDDVVVAEGTVQAMRRDGGMLDAAFCDVFVMRGGKIRQLTSYLVEIK
jgi:ketosteroid isomerase-like protein